MIHGGCYPAEVIKVKSTCAVVEDTVMVLLPRGRSIRYCSLTRRAREGEIFSIASIINALVMDRMLSSSQTIQICIPTRKYLSCS